MTLPSPIFLLSETLRPILEHLRNDTESLYKCMFVNRTWCRIAVPILWHTPFKIWLPKRLSLITTLIGCLDEVSKSKLLLFQDFPSEALVKPMFDYSSLLYDFHYPALYDMVKSWCDEQGLSVYYNAEDDFYLFPVTTILEMLIERIMDKSNLSKLSIPTVTHRHGDYVCLLKHDTVARKCLPKIRYLDCDDCKPENLIFASEYCTNLDRLDIDCSWGNDYEVLKLLMAQRNLQHITVTKRWPHLNNMIEIGNLSQSLKCVVFKDNKNHKDNGGPLSVLASCKRLEILRFDNWLSLPEEDMKELASNFYPRLRKLSITRCKPTADVIITMIMVNGLNLQELTLSWKTDKCNQFSVIMVISKSCPNLRYLDVPIEKSDLLYFSNLLRSCEKLQNMTINLADNESVEDAYEVDNYLLEMSTIIPKSLYQLNIFAPWKFSAESIRKFLMNTKNDFRCLGFLKYFTDGHLKVIAEYAYKRKTLKYLELRWCETSFETRKSARESIDVVAVYNCAGRRTE